MNKEATRDINIKGIRDGLLISLSSALPFDQLDAELTAEIRGKRDFLRGSRVVLDVGGRNLMREQLEGWQELFAQSGMALWAVLSHREGTRAAARDLGLATRLPGSQMDLNGNGRPEPVQDSTPTKPAIPPNALLIQETVRSGRAIYYEGHVVIVGDVNPGAEVVAEGNIIVWGKLRGLVHAGALGDTAATVRALDLSPTQLRIADHIATTPKSKLPNPVPETAVIRDGRIVAEPWT